MNAWRALKRGWRESEDRFSLQSWLWGHASGVPLKDSDEGKIFAMKGAWRKVPGVITTLSRRETDPK
jgi:hypothetical protein